MGYLSSWGTKVVLQWPSGSPGAGPAPRLPEGHLTTTLAPHELRYPILGTFLLRYETDFGWILGPGARCWAPGGPIRASRGSHPYEGRCCGRADINRRGTYGASQIGGLSEFMRSGTDCSTTFPRIHLRTGPARRCTRALLEKHSKSRSPIGKSPRVH